jgi:hypothetical protein
VEDIPVDETSSVLCPVELLFKILPVLSVGIFMVQGAVECGADELVVYIGSDSGCRECDYYRGWLLVSFSGALLQWQGCWQLCCTARPVCSLVFFP